MVEISITPGQLHLEVKGLDKLWAFKGKLEIPLKHIRSVRHDPKAARGWWHGFRMPGSQLPGVFTAGTFYQNGEKIFWDVHNPDNAIVIELHDERYNELIVEVENPSFAVDQIRGALSSNSGSDPEN
jgi:hypothetical protein